MKTAFFQGEASSFETDLLVFTLGEDQEWSPTLKSLDEALGGLLAEVAEEQKFVGKADSSLQLHTHGKLPARRVALLGVGGEGEELTSVRNHAARAAQMADQLKLKTVGMAVGGGDEKQAAQHARFAFEGARLGLYRFNRHRSGDEARPSSVEMFTLVSSVGYGDGVAQEMSELASATSAGVALARDLVNEGPQDMIPEKMAEVAQQIAADQDLECRIYDLDAIKDMNMRLLLAVNAGSDLEPRLIHLTYRPEGATDDTPSIALVGKGLTFDAGGYSLKPTGAMEDMKIDMAGGAAVLGAMSAIRAISPRCVVHAIVPSTENLVNGRAYKLGDVYRGLNGKSVEIKNTDAEGRLILADALCYAQEQGVQRMISLATLTGACVVALGPYTCGVMGNNEPMVRTLLDASERVGEDVWQLPLSAKLKRMLKSEVADMKNVGERWGGAITAGLFLQEFVGETEWVHLDLAGPSFVESPAEAHIPKGGSGFGVLSLLEYVSGLA